MKKQSRILSWLYYTRSGSVARHTIATKRFLTTVTGWVADKAISKRYITRFLRAHPSINMDEFTTPAKGFKTFNEFFYRKLSTFGRLVRPMDPDPEHIVAPADCYISVVEELEPEQQLFIKGCRLNMATFLGNNGTAQAYYGGTMVLCRLEPHHYHRFHFPCAAVPSHALRICGKFDSVNPIAYSQTTQPLASNERHIITLKTERFGEIGCVPVGALCVGRINETYIPGIPYKKGEEMGYFGFGASTIALLFKKNTITIQPALKATSLAHNKPDSQRNQEHSPQQELRVHMGYSIGSVYRG